MTDAEQQKAIASLFAGPIGRQAMQAILEYAGVFEAPLELTRDEELKQSGARGLALDIATIAGLLPSVEGSRPTAGEETQADQATGGERPPGGDGQQEADH